MVSLPASGQWRDSELGLRFRLGSCHLYGICDILRGHGTKDSCRVIISETEGKEWGLWHKLVAGSECHTLEPLT